MKPITALLLTLVSSLCSAGDVIDLWQGPAPYSKPSSLEEYVKESWGVPCVHNVTRATLTVYPAQAENSKRAMVILPGGGSVLESIEAEGRLIAEYLVSRGLTAAVRKYRLPLPEASAEPHLVPLSDARRAISLMRSLARRYDFDPSKVGIMGFSAGGHLAATASAWVSDKPDENPDFSALVYPPTTMSADNQTWLEKDLFHRPMTAIELRQYAPVDNVSSLTPPAFLVHAYDDDVVPISESQAYARALTTVGQEVEVHFFAHGGHGFGPGRPEDGTDQWLCLLAEWIKRR